MPRWFEEQTDQKASWRAVQLWQILVGCAYNQQLITYGQLAEILGYDGAGVFAQLLGRIMYYCDEQKLPPLTTLVVNQDAGEPGDGLELRKRYKNVDTARMAVFAADWYGIIPPSADEYQEVWERAKEEGKY